MSASTRISGCGCTKDGRRALLATSPFIRSEIQFLWKLQSGREEIAEMKHTADELAAYLGVTLQGDSGAVIGGVASPEKAAPEDVIYLDAPKNRERVANS